MIRWHCTGNEKWGEQPLAQIVQNISQYFGQAFAQYIVTRTILSNYGRFIYYYLILIGKMFTNHPNCVGPEFDDLVCYWKKDHRTWIIWATTIFLKDSFPNNAIIDGDLIPIFTLNYHLFALSRSLSLSENFFDVKHLPSKKKCDSLLFLRLCKYCPLRVLKIVTSSSSN